jgi:hypothetical protein
VIPLRLDLGLDLGRAIERGDIGDGGAASGGTTLLLST